MKDDMDEVETWSSTNAETTPTPQVTDESRMARVDSR